MTEQVMEAGALGSGSVLEPARTGASRLPMLLLILIALISTVATIAAMRRTSPTFDEVVLYTAGARGYNNGGTFDLAPDHPPLMQYIYGLPVYLAGPEPG